MVHTTETLQQVFAELVQDEINHMTKFWGFGVWLFPESYPSKIRRTLSEAIAFKKLTQQNHLRSTAHLNRTFQRMMGVLYWNSWSLSNKAELFYTFISVLHRLWRWNSSLTSEYLQQLLGQRRGSRGSVGET